jgi:hypothetical protein
VAGVEDVPAVASGLKELAEVKTQLASLQLKAGQLEARLMGEAATAREEKQRAAPRSSPSSRQSSGGAAAAATSSDVATGVCVCVCVFWGG